MPRGDRTGPAGAGPMTGRAAGYCGGNDSPGFANRAYGRGGFWGFGGRAGGRGWRNMYWATGMPGWARPWGPAVEPPPAQELDDLKAQANWLSERLESVRARIEALGRSSSQQDG